MELHRGFSPLDPRHKNLQKRPDLHRGPSIKPRPPPPPRTERTREKEASPWEAARINHTGDRTQQGRRWSRLAGGGGARPRGGVLSINEVPPTASSPGSEGWREGSTVMTVGVGDQPRLHQPSIRAPEGPVKLTPARLPTPTATGWAAKSVREVGAAARGGALCVSSPGFILPGYKTTFQTLPVTLAAGPEVSPGAHRV